MTNSIASRVVKKYLDQKEPRHALLVDAPWGSGKTHFIKHATNCEADETRLYVSLYNVHSAEEFDWALVRAMKPWTEGVSGKRAARFKEFVSGVKAFGCSVDLTKVNITEIVLENLPDTLIFDDVERCGLPPRQLWGLINRFVEHEGKRVILVINSEKHTKKKKFKAIREKLVGQVVTIQADIDAAMASVWVNLPGGQGRNFLQKHQAAIRETFEEARHQNLRLLLRAMRDAVDLIDKIDAEMVKFGEPMERLLRTFLALHMAYHGGKISKKDLKNRGEIARFYPHDKSAAPTALKELETSHPKADIDAFSGPVLPVELACSLISDGFASKEEVTNSLKATHHFAAPEEQPDWVRLWNWLDEDIGEIDAINLRVDQAMDNSELVDPGEILQIYAAQEFAGGWNCTYDAKVQARKFYDYICKLGAAKKFPARLHGNTNTASRDIYGFSWRSGGAISYGGYAFDPDRRARLLVKRMVAEMDSAHADQLPKEAVDLLKLLRGNPLAFAARLEYPQNAEEMNLAETPVLHLLSRSDVAKAFLELFDECRDAAATVAAAIGARKAPRRKLGDEQDWIEQLKQQIIDDAEKVSPGYGAQVKLFLKRNFEPE